MITIKDKLKGLAFRYRQVPPIRLKEATRFHILDILAECGATVGAEIGVCRGHFSEEMFKRIPNLKLYCVDSWLEGEDAQSQAVGQKRAERRYAETKRRLSMFDATIIRKKSMDAVRDVPDNSLDFVYVDACHDFDYVMEDIIAWGRKVKPGGLIAGDDYYRFTTAGVVTAVDAYIYSHKITEAFITSEVAPSFFMLKPDEYPFKTARYGRTKS